MQAATKVKMSGSNTYEISSVKRVTIVITGDWLWKTTNIKYKKNGAAVYVGSSLTVQKSFVFCWQIVME